MKLYIAGPMTGYPDYNYPAFNVAAKMLQERGYEVENPASNPEQACWSDYLRAALTQMLTCDGVAFLNGWEMSRGAQLERHVAHSLGMQCALVNEWYSRQPVGPT